jgi:hypothetical protein
MRLGDLRAMIREGHPHDLAEFHVSRQRATVAKLRGARDRIWMERGKCEGRKSFAEMDAEDGTVVVAELCEFRRDLTQTAAPPRLRARTMQPLRLGYDVRTVRCAPLVGVSG